MLLRRVLRRRLQGFRVLRRELFIEGAQKVLRRQKHVLSQSTTPFACTLKKFCAFLEVHFASFYCVLCAGELLRRSFVTRPWHSLSM